MRNACDSPSFLSLVVLFYQGKPLNLPRIFPPCRTPWNPGKTRENTQITKDSPCLKLTKEIQTTKEGRTGFGLPLRFGLRCEYPQCQIASDVGRAMRATKKQLFSLDRKTLQKGEERVSESMSCVLQQWPSALLLKFMVLSAGRN